jgi:hypothetical protein
MSVRTTLRLGTALLGLTLVVAACNGATGTTANGGSGANLGAGSGTSAAGDPGLATPAPAEPTFDLGSLLSLNPSPDTTPAATPGTPVTPGNGAQPTPKPAGTTPPAISTTKASSLLSQVDHLLNEMNSELSNADSAANNPGE